MAYSTIGFKDGSTPLNATNMNKMDNQIKANADDISTLNTDLANFSKVVSSSEKRASMDDWTDAGVYYMTSGTIPEDVPVGTNGWLIVLSGSTGTKQLWMRMGTPSSNDYMTYIRSCNISGEWGNWWALTSIVAGTALGNSNTPVYVGANGRIYACGFSYLDLVNLAADAAVAKVQGTEMPDMSILEAQPEEEDIAIDED